MPGYSLALLVFSALPSVCGSDWEGKVKSKIPQLIPYPSSFEDARAKYYDVGQQILALFPTNGPEKYEVLVSFPTSDCVEYHAEDNNYGAGVVNFTNYNGVNVFVTKYNRTKVDKAFREARDVIKSEANNAMDMTLECPDIKELTATHPLNFSDPVGSQYSQKFNDLCYRVRDVDKWTMGKLINAHFRALVSFRCARRFVWYELGWHFYEAFWTSSEDVFHYNDRRDDWGNSCGTFVFFP